MKIDIKGKHLPLRTLLAASGILLNGVAVGIFKRAALGVDPYQCFAGGLNILIPISFGTLYMLVNIVQLIIVFFMDKHYIGISTLLNLFLVGYAAEFTEKLLWQGFPELGIVARVGFLLFGIVLTCFAAALYYTADLGVSTYDAIPLHIADTKPKIGGKVIPFRYVRVCTDLICVIFGAVTGFLPGVGTVITALFMGPLITFFRNTVSDPILARAKQKA